MKIDLSCPVELVSVDLNAETQTAEATFFNLSQQTVTAIKYTIVLFDENGEEISRSDAELEGIEFASRESYKAVVAAENAHRVGIIFTEFTFEDGTSFSPSGEEQEIFYDELSDAEKARFERAGAPDACCYAKEEDTYWLCVCGRPNLPAAESCVKCQRAKDDVLVDFASEQSVATAILKKEELDAIEAERLASEEAEKAAQRKAELVKKAKKAGIIAGIAVVAVAALILILSLIFMLIGDSHASKGEYAKAASMYNMSLFNKTDKIADDLYGNSASNLVQGGILAEDDNYVYYLNAYYGICVENKETGEKTKTEFTGSCLNASGGKLYFINLKDNYQIYSMDPATLQSELVYASPVYYFATAGNDIYFIADKILKEGEESDPSAPPSTPLYLLKEGEAEPKLISEASISLFTIYKNKIYYVDYSDDYSLYTMSLSGKGAKKIIKTPVYNFDIYDNKIYFTDGTIPEGSENGIPKLSLEVASLGGGGRKTLIDTAVVKSFNVAADGIYYTDNNNTTGSLLKYQPDGQTVTEAEEVYLVNTCGDFVYYLAYDGKMYLTKLDKSGYEVVSTLDDAPEETAETQEGEQEAPAE